MDSPSTNSQQSRISFWPRTPQPPFSPPQRNSSLNFSNPDRRIVAGCLDQQHDGPSQQTTDSASYSRPNIGRKRTTPYDAPSPGHVAQMQRVFQAARATLHRDMFAASSPAASIESRMNMDTASPAPDNAEGGHVLRSYTEEEMKSWRYSMAPQHLASIGSDVREPLPSPTLPESTVPVGEFNSATAEPFSSGFTSPTLLQSLGGMTEAAMTGILRSGPPNDKNMADVIARVDRTDMPGLDESELLRPISQLKVSDEESGKEPSPGQESPIVNHLKCRSRSTSEDIGLPSSPTRDFYLSPSAEAAAESAKAKRRMLRDNSQAANDDRSLSSVPARNERPQIMICPDPALHEQVGNLSSCPDPSLHQDDPRITTRPGSGLNVYMHMLGDDDDTIPRRPAAGASRATSTGSPMPFTRAKPRPTHASGDRQRYPLLHHPYRQENQYMNTLNEHFQPGWYYAQDQPVRIAPRPAYSFSTAASKVHGSDPAPDSQMRESYNTDTLTALPKPPNRYRKNGIGAEVQPRGVSRYYQRPRSSMRPPTRGSRPSSRRTYTSGSDVRFRSSPPRAPSAEHFVPARRKRAMDDSFMLAEDTPATRYSNSPAFGMRGDDDLMEVDEQTKAAVRLSIFGTSTPEALRGARQGIKELSPNVQIFRKGTEEQSHMRKKRRPSYWDNDLREVRESPAGRGGVNSPFSAQESMKAEFEIASLGTTEMDLDENDLSGEVARAGMNLDKRLSYFRADTVPVPGGG